MDQGLGKYLMIAGTVSAALGVVFAFWWLIFRSNQNQTQVVSTVADQAAMIEDDAPIGYDRYFDENLDLEFFYPEEWALSERDFGNAAEIEDADISLIASSFDLSYFADNDARVILDLPAERFCEQTNRLNSWNAFEDNQLKDRVNDNRCSKPDSRRINNYVVYTFRSEAPGLATFAIFLPFNEGGGMVFSDNIPIPEDVDETEAQNIIDSMETGLRERIVHFSEENEALLVAE